MSAFRTGRNAPLGVPDLNPGTIDTTERLPVGTIVEAFDETQGYGEFIYMPGVASCAEGDIVLLDLTPGTEAVVRASTSHANRGQAIGVAMGAITAGKYGWFQISGAAVINVAASFAAGNKVFLTATAGTVDDAAVNGCQILPCYSLSAIGTPDSGQAYVHINRSFVQGQVV